MIGFVFMLPGPTSGTPAPSIQSSLVFVGGLSSMPPTCRWLALTRLSLGQYCFLVGVRLFSVDGFPLNRPLVVERKGCPVSSALGWLGSCRPCSVEYGSAGTLGPCGTPSTR